MYVYVYIYGTARTICKQWNSRLCASTNIRECFETGPC